MPSITDPAGYWDRYGRGVADETPEDALKNAFGWCQYEGHGPGDELLGDPLTTLELGHGRGNAVAALATMGITATGVDLSPVQVEAAHARWGELANAHFERGDVLDFLITTNRRWDAIYSIWGAVWFTDPNVLLPAVLDRLAPGGRLVFSHAPHIPDTTTGAIGMWAAGYTGAQVAMARWSYHPDQWTELLTRHGYTEVHARVLPAPDPANVGTLLVESRRRR
ncbi:class I SAM-dependent methyltransferase [Amycolatopsis cihanbeyliensis]|uniref:Methyltransferase family protein n=1 Tax=Amycolatopsis cihanbeyliensis TaxID=1128664 RepID=A0A542DDR4_AMYCI|nr:class I SAM-dependent methyltransferase [Amycolatopsis cihanbeyliensis]TQJ01210.1 methyltransferase family protein [Amycolatopsis cihanbeyliensis]